MKTKLILIIVAILLCVAPVTAQRYHDAAVDHIKGPVKASYKVNVNGERHLWDYSPDGRRMFDGKIRDDFDYDANGYPTKCKNGGDKGHTYIFQNGLLVSRYNSKSNVTTKYSYDSKGNLIKQELYEDGRCWSSSTYSDIKTDSYGNPTSYTKEYSGIFGRSKETVTFRYEYYTEGSSPSAESSTKPSAPRESAHGSGNRQQSKMSPVPVQKPQTKSELSVLDFFEYPCGDTKLSWNMNFTEARSALGSNAKKCREPARYFGNKDSEGEIYLEGKSPIEFGLADFKAYMLDGHIDYRGRSLNTLEYNYATAWIAFYKNDEEYISGQDKLEYSRSHSRLTEPGKAAYDYLVEKLKESGAQIRKWKYDSYECVKSCKAIYKGRIFLLMLNKSTYGNYFLEIKTAAYYTENT